MLKAVYVEFWRENEDFRGNSFLFFFFFECIEIKFCFCFRMISFRNDAGLIKFLYAL